MNLFLIGSGFTKSIYPNAPLNNGLLHALANDKPDCASNKLIDRYDTDDIEIARIIERGRVFGQTVKEIILQITLLRK